MAALQYLPLPKVILTLLASTALAHGQDSVTAPPTKAPPLNEAPHLFHQTDGSIVAKWITNGEIKTRRFAKGKPIQIPEFSAVLGSELRLTPYKVGPATWAQPEKFLAISDVEGQYDFMFRFLKNSGVIDKSGAWTYGKGHLVCIGDMVDRGEHVTETLLLLVRLFKEARKAGGYDHYVLGNHEVMMMGGDIRYTADKYKAAALKLGIPCRGLLGADTEVGRFLRSRHTIVRVGDYLFVHAGISPPIANTRLGMDKLNELTRSVLGIHPSKIEDKFTQSVSWGRPGPLWYRGYFEEYAASFGPKPTPDEMDKILTAFGAKTIVIGHTKVTRVGSMYEKRRVLAIDIPWTDVNEVRGIIVEGGKLDVVDALGKRVAYK